MTSLTWHRAFSDPRVAIVNLTWSNDIGAPELLDFTFQPNAWNPPVLFKMYRRHGRFRLQVVLDGVTYEAYLYGLSNAELPDEVAPLVLQRIAEPEIHIVREGQDPAAGSFRWGLRPTRTRSVLRAIARVLTTLADDWRAIQRFAAGDPPPRRGAP